jgi:hypothetical protein
MTRKIDSRNGRREVDKKWKQIFEDLGILEKLENEDKFIIDANQIKKYKEPRLMTKFDHRSNLPDIFFDNELSILPVTRGKYVIGRFDAYTNISAKPKDFNNNFVEEVFPNWIESIDTGNISSEAIMINVAQITSMLNDFLDEEELYSTVNGRMGSGEFNFVINSNKSLGRKIPISVKNSQLEIDAGFESSNALALIEAKSHKADSILIRQLYYPYRLWKNTVKNKDIKPIYLQYDNGIYNFSLFSFKDPNNYNSIRLIKRKNYVLSRESISLEDIINISKEAQYKIEPSKDECVFPQANTLGNILDIIKILQNAEKDVTPEELTRILDFTYRQAYYYGSAGKYLGIFEMQNKKLRMLKNGALFKGLGIRERKLLLTKLILEHEPFNLVFKDAIKNTGAFDSKRTVEILRNNDFLTEYSTKTIFRRASTVNSWLKAILSYTDDY